MLQNEPNAEEEDVESQLDRLNQVIAKTLEEAKTNLHIDRSQREDLDDSLSEQNSARKMKADLSQEQHSQVDIEPGFDSEEDEDFYFQSELEDYLKSIHSDLERAQMSLEEANSTALRLCSSPIHIEVDSDQVTGLLLGLERLQSQQSSDFRFGPLRVTAVLKGGMAGGQASGWEEEHSQFKLACEILRQQQVAIETRERLLVQRIQDFEAQYAQFSQDRNYIREKEERLMQAALVQNVEAHTLKEKIEQLLHEQQESALDISSIYASEVSFVAETPPYEAELDALRKQILSLNMAAEDYQAVKREMDSAEDILVGVLNGDESRKFYLQLNVVKNKLVQIRGKQVIRDTEKIATSINSTLSLLENDRKFQKSKNRIREQLIKKLLTPVGSPPRSPPTEQGTSPARNVIVSLEAITSPTHSPQPESRQEFELSVLLPKRDAKESLGDKDALLALAEERIEKLRKMVRSLQTKIDRYKSIEKKLISDRTQNKISEKKLILLKSALEQRESALNARENELAAQEDSLRIELAKSLNTREAREFLTQRAKLMAEQSQRMAREVTLLEMGKAEIKAAKEEVFELRKMLEKERKKIGKDQAKVEREKKKVTETRKQLEEFLPHLVAA